MPFSQKPKNIQKKFEIFEVPWIQGKITAKIDLVREREKIPEKKRKNHLFSPNFKSIKAFWTKLSELKLSFSRVSISFSLKS